MVAQTSAELQAASSSRAPSSQVRAAEHNSIGTPRTASPSRGRSDECEPESTRSKLISWPDNVHGEHMRTICALIGQQRLTEAMRQGAIPNMPTLWTKSGVVFATRA